MILELSNFQIALNMNHKIMHSFYFL